MRIALPRNAWDTFVGQRLARTPDRCGRVRKLIDWVGRHLLGDER
jgi:hypothetical protein